MTAVPEAPRPEVLRLADHQAVPETYDCRACGEPWPCEPGKTYLLESTSDHMQLSIRLWQELEAAAGVLRGVTPSQLFDRFLRWAKPRDAGDQ